MPRKLLIINAVLITIAAGSAAFVVRQISAPMPLPVAKSRPPGAATAPVRADEQGSPGADGYTSVAARNLFSPTRTEAPASATAASTSPSVKPNLFGVVLREGAPMAYLEDPSTKRVAGYRVGDNVAGGTVQTISADSVVITRPDGKMDVRLRDPARPRPAAVPGAAAVRPGTPTGPLPGVIPPVASPGAVAPGAVPQAPIVQQPGQGVQPTPALPSRRPLPPNLLRRLPQGAPPDASQR